MNEMLLTDEQRQRLAETFDERRQAYIEGVRKAIEAFDEEIRRRVSEANKPSAKEPTAPKSS